MDDTTIINNLKDFAELISESQKHAESAIVELHEPYRGITERGLVGADMGSAASEALNCIGRADGHLRTAAQALSNYGRDTETAIDVLNNK